MMDLLLFGDERMSADFLAVHQACYADEDGGLTNQISTKGQNMLGMKDELTSYPRLENLNLNKVDPNEKVLGSLQQLLKERDFKL